MTTPKPSEDSATRGDDKRALSTTTVVTNVLTNATTPPPTGLTLDDLKRNYQAIVDAQSIYYPVAYQFLRELGRGRQGIVYLALRQGARGCITEHAVKIFDPAIYRSPEEYWTDMGRIAAQISRLHLVHSPHLVARHAYDETYGIGYVQMEAIDGVNLRTFLTRSHLDIARQHCTEEEWETFSQTVFRNDAKTVRLQPGLAIYLLRRILRGLEQLHAKNFVHSDVKPANIMIDRLGHVRVVDFGRATMATEPVVFLLGSPMYMAPETHRREPTGVVADLYSVGLVGLEMLSGTRLASGTVSDDEWLQIKLSLPDRLGELLPPDVVANDELFAFLRRLLDPDPGRRYATAKDAEAGDEGLVVVDKQLVRSGLDTESARDLSDYLAKLVDARTKRVET